jgi:VWFA-related protein
MTAQGKRVIVVMPAYNAAATLVRTWQEVIIHPEVDQVVVVDDGSHDDTVRVARTLERVHVHTHERNRGYGANQKTCYRIALEQGADIVVMIHPDYQYTPKLIPAMVGLVSSGLYECVLGSRILGGGALKGGMPWWRYVSNRVLTLVGNALLGTKVSEFHTGYRAYSRALLEQLPLEANSDDFVFDNQVLAQVAWFGHAIGEVSCPTKYAADSSSISFARSVKYGFGCLATAAQFRLARWGVVRSRRFPSLLAAVVVACVLAASPAAQQMPRFTAAATGVRVDVLVTERNRPMPGLTVADFELRDNGVLQDIDIVESSDGPINVVLAFDVSGSTTGGTLPDLIEAGRALVTGLRDRDRVALVTFDHAVAQRVPLTSDFTEVERTLAMLQPFGQTSIFDGIHTALLTTQAEAGRSLVIVFTDGRDTQSWLAADEVTDVARRSNAVVYAVAADSARQWTELDDITRTTGGHTIEIEKRENFRAEIVRVLEEFRSRYVITFAPRGVEAGGFHTLDVKVRREGLRVRARPGYISLPGRGGR